MNMNNPLENLRQLTEAVRMAGADIAPTYIEYVQLAFAIANDCGEAGRNDFLSLCSLSSKYDEKNAQALFSNALHADKEDIHLGTVFHLAGQCGVKISGSAGPHKAGTMGTAGTAPDFPHTCARYNKVENEEKETGKKIDVISLSYNRLMNHIKYMVARVSTGETLKLDMNEYIEEKYPESYRIAEDVCESLGKSLGKKLDPIEIGYLAMHIERTVEQ